MRGTVRDMTLIALFAALMAVSAWITVPGPVPFTLQTMGVFVSVGLLGGRRGTLAVALYLLLGAVGAPVFSGFRGGVGALLGTTGGYLTGFLLSALVMWGMTKLFGSGTAALAAAMAAGLLVCYVFGTAWFVTVYARTAGPVSAGTALGWCVLPFLPFDCGKLVLALLLTRRLRRFVPAG
jgi:biotin transport system substrate-specific component